MIKSLNFWIFNVCKIFATHLHHLPRGAGSRPSASFCAISRLWLICYLKWLHTGNENIGSNSFCFILIQYCYNICLLFTAQLVSTSFTLLSILRDKEKMSARRSATSLLRKRECTCTHLVIRQWHSVIVWVQIYCTPNSVVIGFTQKYCTLSLTMGPIPISFHWLCWLYTL